MSQHGRYQFHMGCGEPLCSQWKNPLAVTAAMVDRRTAKPRRAGKRAARSGHKA